MTRRCLMTTQASPWATAATYLRTTNGGAYWAVGRLQVTGVILDRDETLRALSIVDQNFAVAAGYNGVVYKTLDRGATWQSIGYPHLPTDYPLATSSLSTMTSVMWPAPPMSDPGLSHDRWRPVWTALNSSHRTSSISSIPAMAGWRRLAARAFARPTVVGPGKPMTFPNNGWSADPF